MNGLDSGVNREYKNFSEPAFARAHRLLYVLMGRQAFLLLSFRFFFIFDRVRAEVKAEDFTSGVVHAHWPIPRK